MNYESACRFAWNSTKKPTQPEYDQLIESYRDMLSARAEAVLATGMVDDGPFANFEQAVLKAPPEPAVSSDQGYEQVTDEVEPFEIDPVPDPSEILDEAPESQSAEPAETIEDMEASRKERAKRREEAQPKKKPIRKVVVAVKKAAKKPAPKKGKK